MTLSIWSVHHYPLPKLLGHPQRDSYGLQSWCHVRLVDLVRFEMYEKRKGAADLHTDVC